MNIIDFKFMNAAVYAVIEKSWSPLTAKDIAKILKISIPSAQAHIKWLLFYDKIVGHIGSYKVKGGCHC